jgi:hypothetical protein
VRGGRVAEVAGRDWSGAPTACAPSGGGTIVPLRSVVCEEGAQAQAGHASIESTRIYLHLADDWLRGEYMRAAEAIDAQADPTEGEAA